MASVNPRASSLWEDYDLERSDSEDGDFDRQDPELARRESDGRTPVGFQRKRSRAFSAHLFIYVARQDDRSYRNGELSVDFVVIVWFWCGFQLFCCVFSRLFNYFFRMDG